MDTDKKMLELLSNLKEKGVIRFDTEFCKAISMKKQNLTRVKQGKAHFTPEHIKKAFLEYEVDANWILGTLDNESTIKR